MVETSTLLPIIEQLDLPRVPQQARSRQKRDAILAAAGALFAERGYAATTADDIALAANVSVGTFYSYFRNKRQVFLTLLATCVESLCALGIGNVDYSTNPRQVVGEVIHLAILNTQRFYGLRRAWQELMPIDEEVAALHLQFKRWLSSQIEAAVRRVAAAGLSWPDLDIPETCWLITLLIDQVPCNKPLPPGDQAEFDRQHQALADMVFRAVFDLSRQ